jgi:hypothetical protein
MGVSVSLLPRNRLLVAHDHRFGIFEIPPFPESNQASDIIDVSACWSIDFESDPFESPCIGPIIGQYGTATHISHCTVLTRSYLHVLEISPATCSVVSHRLPDSACPVFVAMAGTRRMVWSGRPPRRGLNTSTFTFSGDVKFGSINVPIQRCMKEIHDVDFDEASGRICVLFNSLGHTEARIVIMDVI